MDCSELLSPVVAALVFAFAFLAWFRARRIAARAARLVIQLVAALLAAGATVFIVAVLVIGLGYTRHLPTLVSPDRKHVALVAYTVNDGTSSDIAEVSVRSAWIPYSYRVYTGPAAYQATPAEPEVFWTDATHLTIRFHRYPDLAGEGIEQGCAAAADGISIRCEETLVRSPR
jgi:hypothetical protein